MLEVVYQIIRINYCLFLKSWKSRAHEDQSKTAGFIANPEEFSKEGTLAL